EHLAAGGGRHAGPASECASRGRDRALRVVGVALGDARPGLAGARVGHLEATLALRADPLAVDEQRVANDHCAVSWSLVRNRYCRRSCPRRAEAPSPRSARLPKARLQPSVAATASGSQAAAGAKAIAKRASTPSASAAAPVFSSQPGGPRG